MCNLGEGIEEKGIEKGLAIGREQQTVHLILSMYKNGISVEQIAAVTNKNVADVKGILEEEIEVLA